MAFSFQNIARPGLRYGVEEGADAVVRIQESADGKTWTNVGASNTTIKPGGEAVVTVLSQKQYLAIAGMSAKGGVVRVGDLTLGLIGKRSLGVDGDAAHLAEAARPEWP